MEEPEYVNKQPNSSYQNPNQNPRSSYENQSSKRYYENQIENRQRERRSCIDYEPLYLELQAKLQEPQVVSPDLISFEELQNSITLLREDVNQNFAYGSELVKFLNLLNIKKENLNNVRSFLEAIGFYCKEF